MMFQEFVNRSGDADQGHAEGPRHAVAQVAPHHPADVHGAVLRVRARRRGPDRLRPAARPSRGPRLHPLQETIMRIHIPRRRATSPSPGTTSSTACRGSTRYRRKILGVISPLILGLMARIMLTPPARWSALRHPQGRGPRGVPQRRVDRRAEELRRQGPRPRRRARHGRRRSASRSGARSGCGTSQASAAPTPHADDHQPHKEPTHDLTHRHRDRWSLRHRPAPSPPRSYCAVTRCPRRPRQGRRREGRRPPVRDGADAEPPRWT